MNKDWGNWESIPTVFTDMEAWALSNNKWVEVDRAELCTKVHLLTKAEFDDLFGKLPPLPEQAFKQQQPSSVADE